MAGNKTVIEGSSVAASQLKDFFRQVGDGSITGDVLQRFLDHKNPWEVNGSNVTEPKPLSPKVFRTIKGGVERKSLKDLKKALEKHEYSISTYAEQILQKVTVPQSETELDLVVVTVRDLGFTKNTRRDAIYERAFSLGLQLCPDWVGPELCLQYADQPLNEWLRIGMEPLADSDGVLRVFRVDHDGRGRWLSSDYGGPDSVWLPGNQWVFVLPRK